MIKTFLSAILVTAGLGFSSISYSEEIPSEAKLMEEKFIPVEITEKKNKSSLFSLNYSFSRTRIDHQETSSTSGFTSYGDKFNFLTHNIGFGYEKEFFQGSRVSITFQTELGVRSGEDSKANGGSSNKVDSTERAFGYFGGAGVSLNLNFIDGHKNIQPFISAKSIKSSTTYDLRYEDVGRFTRSIEIEYKEDLTSVESSIGARFFNYNSGMMGIIALSVFTHNQDDLSVTATQGSTDFELSNLADIEKENISLKLGFGVLI